MPVTITNKVPPLPPSNIEAETAAAPAATITDRRHAKLLQKLVLSMAVWIFYVPHLAILRLLGPRLGLAWGRVVAQMHWLMTFLGAQRSVRKSLERSRVLLETNLSVSAILRKHLQLKHECFARTKLFNHAGIDATEHDQLIWEVEAALVDRFREISESGKGLIIVGYHFGFFRLSATALSRIFPGCDAVHMSHRTAHYASDTFEAVAQLALEKAYAADLQSGARIEYVDSGKSLLRICRMLMAGDTVAVAADGAFANDFVDVPFLDGKLRMPCGWARLAGATDSNIVVLSDTEIDRRRRQVCLFDHIQVHGNSANEIRHAVAEAAKILDEFIRREPWAWHPWGRLRFEITPEGKIYYLATGAASCVPPLRAVRETSDSNFTESQSVAHGNDVSKGFNITTSVRSDLSEPRRVAIVANSFTPYRIYVHKRIVKEVPDVELSTLMTHGNSYGRWAGLEPPAEIRPVMFGNGEPTIEQTKLKFARREWRKFGCIIRWIEEHKIEAIICQGFGDVGRLRLLHWCHGRNIPCFLTADCNICGDLKPGLRRLMKHIVVGQAIRWSSGVMPCGEYGMQLFERYGATREKCFMFPLVSNLELFSNAPPDAVEKARVKYGFDPQRRRVLYCGRMMPVKRPDLTVNAFRAIARERPNWDLVMMGDGPLRETIANSVPMYFKNRVRWLGLVQDTTELTGIYNQCDVLVLPSDKEPWGMVVIEAAAAGMALVMTDVVGACPELVSSGENGRTFSRGDLPGFIAALREVTDPTNIDEMKANSRRVLDLWLSESDPVSGFRAAMASCGLIPQRRERAIEPTVSPQDQAAPLDDSKICV